MRLLADENVPGPLVRALVAGGCDVEWIRITSPGISDAEVLTRAVATERILLTFDKDLGEIARGSGLTSALRSNPAPRADARSTRERALPP
jgi:predicted nuclease of predicted toxin-antitoxin system